LINGIDTRQYEILDYDGDWNEFKKSETEIGNLLQKEIEGKLLELRNPQNDNSFAVIAIILKDDKEVPPDQDDLPAGKTSRKEPKEVPISNSKDFTQYRIVKNARKIFPRNDKSGKVIRERIENGVKKYLEFLPENFAIVTINGVEMKFDNRYWWPSEDWGNCINTETIQEAETGLTMRIGLLSTTNASSVMRVYYNGFLVQENYANLLPGKLEYPVQGFVSLIGTQWEIKQSREELIENQELFGSLKEKIQKTIENLVGSLNNISNDTPTSIIQFIKKRKSNVQFSVKLPGLPRSSKSSDMDKLVSDLAPHVQTDNNKVWVVPLDESHLLFAKWLDRVLINITRDQTGVYKRILSETEKPELAIFIESQVKEADFRFFLQQLIIKLKEKGLNVHIEIPNAKSGLINRSVEVENSLGTTVLGEISMFENVYEKADISHVIKDNPSLKSLIYFKKKAYYVDIAGIDAIDILGLDDGPKDLEGQSVGSNYYFNAQSERIQSIHEKIDELNDQITELKGQEPPDQEEIKELSQEVDKIKNRYNWILNVDIIELLKGWCL
jgi:uncharacterized protein YdcH (DUF465 family)